MSWVEVVLEGWGNWLRTKGAGQGWGGSLDLDRLCQLAQGRAPGTHTDPVLSELLATEHDDQSPHQRVHRYVLMCSPEEQATAVLRYAGAIEPVEEPEYRDHRRWVVSRGRIAGKEIEMAGWVWFRETHGLPAARIAELTGVGTDTVHARLQSVQDSVRRELLQDARTRKNRRAARRKAA